MLNAIVPVNPMHFVVRSPLPVASLLPALQRAVQQVDPLQPIHQVRTMDEILVASLALQRVGSFMATFFAFAALLMATLGVYGVVSYSVRQRRVEFGTRMALGAMGHDLLMLVLGGGARLTGYGLGFGAIAVAASAWTLVRHLDLHHLTWLPFASSTGMVAGVALAASLAPAWRVSRFTPMMAIRDDPTGRDGSLLDLVRRGIADLTGAVGNGADAAQGYDSALLTEFVDASRRADSTSEALQLALETLRSRLDAAWALIVQFESSGELQRVAVASADGVAAPSELTSGAFLLNRIAHHSGTLPISAGDLDAWIRWAQERRPEHLPEVGALAAAQARAVVALRGKDQILGMLLLGAPLGREAYSAPERRTLRHSADQLALMLENARLTGRILEQEKLRRDLALAAEVQRRLLPDAPPVRDGVTLAAVTIAARNVAGDYYDFLPLSDGRLALALADVSGKGVPAALIMSVVQASLRIISSDPTLPLPVLAARMNEFIYRSTQSNSYATFFYARLDERTLELEYVNAGHNPPFVVRAADEGATIHELALRRHRARAVSRGQPRERLDHAARERRPPDLHRRRAGIDEPGRRRVRRGAPQTGPPRGAASASRADCRSGVRRSDPMGDRRTAARRPDVRGVEGGGRDAGLGARDWGLGSQGSGFASGQFCASRGRAIRRTGRPTRVDAAHGYGSNRTGTSYGAICLRRRHWATPATPAPAARSTRAGGAGTLLSVTSLSLSLSLSFSTVIGFSPLGMSRP